MSEFKKGDRAAYYSGGGRAVVVVTQEPNHLGILQVVFEGDDWSLAHVKQLRRLKPKAKSLSKREFKVGDIVAIYSEAGRNVGVVASLTQRGGLISVCVAGAYMLFHPKQLRLRGPKAKSVRVTREMLAEVWDSAANRLGKLNAKDSSMFKTLCTALGLEEK